MVTIQLATSVPASSGLFGWQTIDLPLLIALPLLLVVSGFFSGSETALFGLSEADRMHLRQSRGLAARAVEALLSQPHMLLITILLGNTTINVLYFVITSVLLMRTTVGPAGEVIMAVVSLLLIVLLGEIVPKVAANASRLRIATTIAPLLLPIHRVIAPARLALSRGVIAPLGRLTTAGKPPRRLHDEELKSLLELSGAEGAIDASEAQLLREVVELRRLRVKDVMTPRVDMFAVPIDARRDDVRQLAEERRFTTMPVYAGDLDHIVGVLHLKRYLLDAHVTSVTDTRAMTSPSFVPDVASLDQLLDLFRRSHTRSAIVIDEYGGTEGVVSVENVVQEIVGDIIGASDTPAEAPRMIGLGRWRCRGDLGVHDWVEAFQVDVDETRISTLGGLVTDRLGRAPVRGDTVEFGSVEVTVESVDRRRVEWVIVKIKPDDPAAAHDQAVDS